ncbi:hypothetical protein L249_4470 [Ophiocordyceps polyrhachis-furcata BCC 54312]|uniref:Uncharacterized protein n=1 Tax=Ophiocordyceps polyrhachis-furcata BCC 54312 TaxID=1330021 RepID=A0A367L7T2_9HYPO|nr:hypothetical protein L249_4470 [Ophiocordyceps polyrhachis-furcata BCC 54312]
MMMSNQEVMKLKLIINWNTMTWLYVIPFRDLEEDFNVMDQPDDLTLVRPSRSGAITAIGTARRSLAPIDVQRADRCDDRCNEALWRALGLIGTICSKWPYRLISYPFKMKKYALYSS